MTQPDRTNHERVLHHLRNATGHLETSRLKSIAATQHHLEHNPVPTNDSTTDSSSDDDTTQGT